MKYQKVYSLLKVKNENLNLLYITKQAFIPYLIRSFIECIHELASPSRLILESFV